jgi:hypothetical protein
MARVLIIAVAVLLGAAGVWFLVPTPAATGASGSLSTSQDVASKPTYSGSPMSAEKRRTRAENLVGQPFKYISKDEVYSASWFTDKGPQAIERAMDECAILSNEELFMQHVMESADSSVTDTEDLDVIEHLKSMRPTFKQLRNCINAKIAYNGLFKAEG